MKKWKSWFVVFAVGSIVYGCGGEETFEPQQETRQHLDDMEGWENWTQISDGPFVSGSHGDFAVTYGNDVATQAFNGAEGSEDFSFPEGSIFIKEARVEEDGEAKALDTMIKLSDQQGDWYWLKSTPDRERIVNDWQGTDVSICVDCHVGASETDEVFVDFY